MTHSVQNKPIFDSSWGAAAPSPVSVPPAIAQLEVSQSPNLEKVPAPAEPLLEAREMRNAYVTGVLQGAGLPHPGGVNHKKKLITTGLLMLGGWAANQATNGVALPVLTAAGGVLGGKKIIQGHSTLQEARRDKDAEKAREAFVMMGQGTPGVCNFVAAVPGATNRWVSAFGDTGATSVLQPPGGQTPIAKESTPQNSVEAKTSVSKVLSAPIDDDPLAILEMDHPLSGEKIPSRRPKIEPKGVELLKDFDVETARAKLELIFKDSSPSSYVPKRKMP